MKSWLLIHQSHRLLEKNEKAVLKKAGLTPRKHAGRPYGKGRAAHPYAG